MSTCSKKIGLALGGGAARGIAHIQALHAMDDLGLKPHRIAGTSMGALVGAGYAAGLTASEIEDLSRRVLSNKLDAARRAFASPKGGILDLINFNPLTSPLIDGRQLVTLVLPDTLPSDISMFEIPLTIVATDFYKMTEVAITNGDPIDAIAASIAIPGFISAPPGPDLLIDGGCVNPVPISHLQDDCDLIAAINVIGKPTDPSRKQLGAPDLLSGANQIQQHTIAAMHRQTMRCDIWIEPEIDRFRAHEFFAFEDIMKASAPFRDQLKRQLEEALNK